MGKFRLAESIENNVIEYYFVGFDDWRDFDNIFGIIKSKIRPQRTYHEGATDMTGYFEKDELRVDFIYISMGINYLEFKGEQTPDNIAKVKAWAQLIFDELMKGLEKS